MKTERDMEKNDEFTTFCPHPACVVKYDDSAGSIFSYHIITGRIYLGCSRESMKNSPVVA